MISGAAMTAAAERTAGNPIAEQIAAKASAGTKNAATEALGANWP